jgi:hypothetical protein
MTSKAKVAEAMKIARGVFEGFEARALAAKDSRARDRALHTAKRMIGLMLESGRKKTWGAPKGKRNGGETDLQVIADEKRYGSIPKAVQAYMDDGRLPVRAIKTHVDRINKLKRATAH